MKIARFTVDGQPPRFGIVDETEIVVLDGDPMFAAFETTGERIALTGVKLLAPVIPRSKVVAVGRNYVAHAEEFGNAVPDAPLLFLKPNTSVIGPEDTIRIPPVSSQVEHEGELAVIIGRPAKNVSVDDALDYVFGYTIANDVTARDIQKADGQWARAKGFDTFCPLGPVIETEFDASNAALTVRVDGELRQSSTTALMVHSVASIVSYASHAFTLLPGDVILTGTPEGVGKMDAGQRVEVAIDGLGILANPIA